MWREFFSSIFDHTIAPWDSRGAWQEIALDVRKAPTDIDLSPSKIGPAFILVGGMVFLFGGAAELVNGTYDALWESLLITGFGAFAIATAAHALQRTVRGEFTKQSVRVTSKTAYGVQSWNAFYTQFKGLRRYQRTFRTNRGSRRHFHIVELVHSDPAKTLPIFVTEGAWLYDDWVQRYLEFFDLPLLGDQT